MNFSINKEHLIDFYQSTRACTEQLCAPLAIEDYVIQTHADVSPPKWHLAHTSWFFETFLLKNRKDYVIFNPLFENLFNSYYFQIGNPFPRINRGLLSRPTVKNIYEYRSYINNHIIDMIVYCDEHEFSLLHPLITLGIHHEQQHQELLLMDIKANFAIHPEYPAYDHTINEKKLKISFTNNTFVPFEGGIIQIGHNNNKFCFDNELPCHEQLIKPFLFANQLVTNEEFLAFIDAGGYQKPLYWLADGWHAVQQNHWQAPLYWQKINNEWYIFTLQGLKKLNLHEPVVHISFYEADAYARWMNARLPTELEWEHVAKLTAFNGNFLENQFLHPVPKQVSSSSFYQLFGDVWEWTASAYTPYPGFKSACGAIGEYNGKFMSNQMVLRGGSCATPQSHIRATYRNFFQPEKRWQFSGLRLAKDI